MGDEPDPKEASSSNEQTPANEKTADGQITELTQALEALGEPGAVSRSLAVTISMLLSRGGTLPLPPPSLLAEYEKIHPGLVGQIIGWANEQRTHRQSLQRTQVERDERRMDRGQFISAAIALLGLILAAGVGIIGNAFVGSVIATVAVGGPTAAVLLARRGVPSSSSGKAAEPPHRE